MPAGRYLRTEILEWIAGTAFASPPSSIWAHLCTAAPTATAVGTAPAIGGYSAEEITPSMWAAIATGASLDTLSTDEAVTFGPFTGTTETATHIMLRTTSNPATGEMLFYGALAASRSMVDGGTVVVAAGDIDITA